MGDLALFHVLHSKVSTVNFEDFRDLTSPDLPLCAYQLLQFSWRNLSKSERHRSLHPDRPFDNYGRTHHLERGRAL